MLIKCNIPVKIGLILNLNCTDLYAPHIIYLTI